MCGDSWYVTSAPASSRRVRASRLHSTEITGSSAPCPIATARKRRREVELEAGDGRHEARERDQSGGSRPAGTEPERVGHHRSLREATQHGPLGRDSGLVGEVVEPARCESERLRERAGIRVADLLDRVPVRAAGRKVERAARGHAEHSSLGVEQIEQREEVALVGAAAVEEDEQPFWLASRRSCQVAERVRGHVPRTVPASGRDVPLARRGARARPDPSRS